MTLVVQKYYYIPVRLLSVAGFIESTKQPPFLIDVNNKVLKDLILKWLFTQSRVIV